MVPSFISTLAVGGVAYSVARWLSGQRSVSMDAAQREIETQSRVGCAAAFQVFDGHADMIELDCGIHECLLSSARCMMNPLASRGSIHCP